MTASTRIQTIEERLFLISLPVPIDGFDGFIGAWVYTGNPTILVDVGPAVSVPALLSALAEIGGQAPELILLTHIHIDHAGGIGRLARELPRATVVCHPKGGRHLVDPERLWQGSLKTLGRIAEIYGPIAPLPAGRLFPADRPIHPGVLAIDTPGHAAHHYSFRVDELLFAGEAGGVNLPTTDGAIYLRPATPPRFFLETSLDSIDRLLAAEPGRICYGHVGQRPDAVSLLQTHREQLLRWRDWIAPFLNREDCEQDELPEFCVDYLLETDPLLAGYAGLSASVRGRERNFLRNSVKGYLGYLKESTPS